MFNIAVIGSGVVGQATGKVIHQKGSNVTFIDSNKSIVDKLLDEGYSAFNPSGIKEFDFDVLMISVPTYNAKACDNGNAENAPPPTPEEVEKCTHAIEKATEYAADLVRRIDKYCVVIVRSAILPGVTENSIIPILEKHSGKNLGEGFGVCVNPEYLRERHATKDFAKPKLVVIGQSDTRAGEMVEKLYDWAECPIYKTTIKEAEMQKFVHNILNAAKISFYNEMRGVCKEIGVDAEVIFPLVAKSAEASWNPYYGTRDLGPFGGSCLPKDTSAFLRWARAKEIDMPVLKATIEVNKNLK